MKRKPETKAVAQAGANPAALAADLRELILSARQTVARGVNAALVLLYWKIGERIRKDVLNEKRAEYGQEIFSTLSGKLLAEFGRGFSQQNWFRMVDFAEAFPEQPIVATLSQQLGWSHFVELLPPKKILEQKLHDAVRLAQARLQPAKDKTGGTNE